MTCHPIIARTQALIGLLLAMALPVASAANFSVSPTRVELSAQHLADILTFNNGGDEPLRMQVRSMRWTVAADGQWQLTPSDDLIVTPELLEVAPGQSVQMRVGSLLDAGASETSYRLLINELPNLSDDKTDGKPVHGPQIHVLTQVSLPVFVEPAQTTRTPVLSSAIIEHGVMLVGLGNSGTQRMDPQSVKVTVTDRTGRILGQYDQMANYVLPGTTSFLHVKLPVNVCTPAASVSVSWPGMANISLAHPITTGVEACEGKSSP